MAGAAQLLCGSQSGGSAADYGNEFSGGVLGRLGMNPAFVKAAFDDGALDELDGDGRLVDAENAGGFTGSGADAAGELRKVVGGVEAADGGFPAIVVDQVVPIGNEIVDRAAGVAEGNAAVHAASALLALFLFRERLVDFEPILDAFAGIAAGSLFALNLKKTGDFTHAEPLPLQPRGPAME